MFSRIKKIINDDILIRSSDVLNIVSIVTTSPQIFDNSSL